MVVGIVCHDPLFNDSLAALLRSQGGAEVLSSAQEARGAIGQFAKQPPDVLVLVEEGLTEEEISLFTALRTLTSVRSVLISKVGSPVTRAELPVDLIVRREEGATHLIQAIRELARRATRVLPAMVAEPTRRYGSYRPHLTARESEVANLVAQGLPNRRIGVIMGLQEQSVKNLVSVVMRKLSCENRVQVALKLAGAYTGPSSD